MSSVTEIRRNGHEIAHGRGSYRLAMQELALLPKKLAPEFTPSAEDLSWWAQASEEPSPRDWEELALLAEWQYRLEQMHMITDEDIMAAGLPVG